MIIQKLEIISFGKFKNKIIDFSDGVNIVCGNNESGKSTIISFIYAILYGFGDNRGKTLSLRDKFTPWDGGVCEGKLTVKTDGGENICIYRKAGNTKKYDILRIYNADTGEDIPSSPEELVGVSSDTYFKTLCVKQLSTVFEGNNDEITQKLSNIISSGDENTNYEKAQKLLEQSRREIQPLRGNGGELSKVIQQLAASEKNRSTQNNIKAELDSVNTLLSKAEKEVKEIKSSYEELKKEDLDFSIARLIGRMEEIQNRDSDEKRGVKPFTISCIVLFIFSAFMLIYQSRYFFLLLISSFIGILYSFAKKKSAADTDTAEIEAELERLKSKKKVQEEKSILLRQQLSEAEAKTAQLNIRRETLKASLTGTEDNSDALYEKKKALELKLRTVTLASEALKKAHEKMQQNFTPALNKKASEYFSAISGGKYTRIFCDEQFNIKVSGDIPHESEFFSGGTVDQLYLSVRLSLIDMLFKEKSCSLILDQPFLQYDENRKKKTLELLENLPEKRQILLFTSDKNLKSTNKATEILT